MARGITESDVHGAADEIVAAGDRPTVERIRAHLGTGSPNTVTRWLETWWRALGPRLEDQRIQLSLPGAPEAVAVLAAEWWALALDHAQRSASEAIEVEKASIQAERVSLQQERETVAEEVRELRNEVEAAMQRELLAATRASELERLVGQCEIQIKESTGQRDAAIARTAEAEASLQSAGLRLEAVQELARSDREREAQHIRSVEDRAHQEVDRARLESKELQKRLSSMVKDHAELTNSLREVAEQARRAASEASREADVQRTRANALDAQLAQLKDLPAALEAAFEKRRLDTARSKPLASKPRPKRVAKSQA